jgi:hypothetical protein
VLAQFPHDGPARLAAGSRYADALRHRGSLAFSKPLPEVSKDART